MAKGGNSTEKSAENGHPPTRLAKEVDVLEWIRLLEMKGISFRSRNEYYSHAIDGAKTRPRRIASRNQYVSKGIVVSITEVLSIRI